MAANSAACLWQSSASIITEPPYRLLILLRFTTVHTGIDLPITPFCQDGLRYDFGWAAPERARVTDR